MNRHHLRAHLLGLLTVIFAPCLPAAGSAAPEPVKSTSTPVGPVIELPTLKVQDRRIKAIDAELKKLDKQIAREKRQLRPTPLDRSLNSDKLSSAAALLGGNSAAHMAAVAATRVGLLEQERMLLERLKFPRTEEDQALIEQELENNRAIRRNLDNAAKQR